MVWHILRNRFQAAVHHMEKATHVGVFCPSHPEPPRLTRRLITQGITGVSWARIEAELGLLPWHPALLATFESALVRRIGEFVFGEFGEFLSRPLKSCCVCLA